MEVLTQTTKGAIAEAEITASAARLGVVVSRPQMEGRRYDLIFDVAGQLLRVQCKWAPRNRDVVVLRMRTSRYTPSRGYVRTVYSAAEIDAVAAYCPDLNRCFLIPIEQIGGQGFMHLRLAPARNNQRQLIRMADDYDLGKMVGQLGAVVQLGERLHGMQEAAGSSPASSTAQAAPPRGLFAV